MISFVRITNILDDNGKLSQGVLSHARSTAEFIQISLNFNKFLLKFHLI